MTGLQVEELDACEWESHTERALAASDAPEVATVSDHAQAFPKESSQLGLFLF